MPVSVNNVVETSQTTGTGPLDLDGAATGYSDFASQLADGETTGYRINQGDDWEIGIGTYVDGAPPVLQRTVVVQSSNAGSPVSLQGPSVIRGVALAELLTPRARLVTGAATLALTDHGRLIEADATSGAFAITLPGVVPATSAYRVAIKRVDGSANPLTILRSGAATIDGQTSIGLPRQWDTVTLACDGANWRVVSRGGSAHPFAPIGLTMSASGSPADVLTVQPGAIASRETPRRVIELTSAISKDLSTTFAAGDGNGGMLAGHALPTSGQVHVWAITAADGTADVVVTQHSVTGLSGTFTLPSGFVARAYIGTLVAQSGPALAAFHQEGDWIMRLSVSQDIAVTNLGNSDTTYNISATVAAGRKWLIDVTAVTDGDGSAVGAAISIRDPDAFSFGAPSPTNALWLRLSPTNAGRRQANTFQITTDNAAQIVARSAGAINSLYLSVNGWRCPRGEL